MVALSRFDYVLAASQLELSERAVAQARGNRAKLAARVFEFTELVLFDPVVSDCLRQLARTRPASSGAQQESWRRLHAEAIAPGLARLAVIFGELGKMLPNVALPPTDGELSTAFMGQPAWQGCSEALSTLLSRLESEQKCEELTIAELASLKEGSFGHLKMWVDKFVSFARRSGVRQTPVLVKARSKSSQLKTQIATVEPLIYRAETDANSLGGFIRAHSVVSLRERLVEYNSAARAALRPASTLPLPQLSPDSIAGEVEYLSSLLLQELSLGPYRWHVLSRLQTYLEHFGYGDVVSKLKRQERNKRPQRERVLQREIDRFIFQEGFYPITHCEASGGYLDTLVPLYADAKGKRQHPLLIELKQNISFKKPSSVTEGTVNDALDDARIQVGKYRKHIQANADWIHVEPIVLLAHNSPDKFSLKGEGEDVFVIYLGDRTPSGGKRRY